MEIRETGCDREGCKQRGALPFQVFSHRASNGVDTDDWYYTFDLCPDCARVLLRKLLSAVTPELGVELFTSLKIKTRLN
jgi:hypothetical protein